MQQKRSRRQFCHLLCVNFRRIGLTLLLIPALLLSLTAPLPAAQAAEVCVHELDEYGFCSACGGWSCDHSQWSAADSLPDGDGCFYLTDDLAVKSSWEIDGISVCLDLNGHGITYVGSTAAPVIRIRNSGSLTLYDSASDECACLIRGEDSAAQGRAGMISGGTDSGVLLEDSAVFTMYGGTICENFVSDSDSVLGGGGVRVTDHSRFRLYGGSVSGNTASGLNGGGVLAAGDDAVFEMNGGTVENNLASSGGGVSVEAGAQMALTGGIVRDNSAGLFGGGIFVLGCEDGAESADTELLMTSGSIGGGNQAGNEENAGNAVCVQASGSAYILGGQIDLSYDYPDEELPGNDFVGTLWESRRSEIRFDADSGEAADAYWGEANPLSAVSVPFRTGFTFEGYADENGRLYYDCEGKSLVSFWDRVGEATLYAQWKLCRYTILFMPVDGSGGTESVTVSFGEVLPQIVPPTRRGYEFCGYYDSASGGNAYYGADGVVLNDRRAESSAALYAHWSAMRCPVCLDAQGGSGGTAVVTAEYDSAMPEIDMPTLPGYVCTGYFSRKNGGGTRYYDENGKNVQPWDQALSESTLYACWNAESYTLHLDAQGGSGGADSVSAVYDGAMPDLPVPSKDGCRFLGYFSGRSGAGIQYYDEHGKSLCSWNQTEPVTLYAAYEHIHGDWTFSVEGNQITAFCGAPGCTEEPYSLELVLSAKSIDFTGEAHFAHIKGEPDDFSEIVGAEIGEIEYWTADDEPVSLEGAPAEAGDYIARLTLTLEDGKSVTLEKPYSILAGETGQSEPEQSAGEESEEESVLPAAPAEKEEKAEEDPLYSVTIEWEISGDTAISVGDGDVFRWDTGSLQYVRTQQSHVSIDEDTPSEMDVTITITNGSHSTVNYSILFDNSEATEGLQIRESAKKGSYRTGAIEAGAENGENEPCANGAVYAGAVTITGVAADAQIEANDTLVLGVYNVAIAVDGS